MYAVDVYKRQVYGTVQAGILFSGDYIMDCSFYLKNLSLRISCQSFLNGPLIFTPWSQLWSDGYFSVRQIFLPWGITCQLCLASVHLLFWTGQLFTILKQVWSFLWSASWPAVQVCTSPLKDWYSEMKRQQQPLICFCFYCVLLIWYIIPIHHSYTRSSKPEFMRS